MRVGVRDLLLGWVEVLRSGLKKYPDLLALGDVHWQLDEGLREERIAWNLGNRSITATSVGIEVERRLNIVFVECLDSMTSLQ